jgi:RNA polymerase sigma factor for flagellar operon FliA
MIAERNKLIEKYLPLAKKLAKDRKKTIPNYISLDDLVSVAYYGLVDAASKYNSSKCSFGFYAKLRISGELCDYLREICRDSSRYGTSLNACTEDGYSLGETIESSTEKCSKEFFEDVVKNLFGVDKIVFSLYYEKNMTLKEIGCEIGVSEGRVSQILTKGKEIIKDYIVALAA